MIRENLKSSGEIAEKVLGQFELRFKKFGTEVKEIALIINNLGGATDIEMGIFTKDIITRLVKSGVKVRSLAVG